MKARYHTVQVEQVPHGRHTAAICSEEESTLTKRNLVTLSFKKLILSFFFLKLIEDGFDLQQRVLV